MHVCVYVCVHVCVCENFPFMSLIHFSDVVGELLFLGLNIHFLVKHHGSALSSLGHECVHVRVYTPRAIP